MKFHSSIITGLISSFCNYIRYFIHEQNSSPQLSLKQCHFNINSKQLMNKKMNFTSIILFIKFNGNQMNMKEKKNKILNYIYDFQNFPLPLPFVFCCFFFDSGIDMASLPKSAPPELDVPPATSASWPCVRIDFFTPAI